MAGSKIPSSFRLTSPVPHLLNATFSNAAARKSAGQLLYTGWRYFQEDEGTHWFLKSLANCVLADGSPASRGGTWGTLDTHWVLDSGGIGRNVDGARSAAWFLVGDGVTDNLPLWNAYVATIPAGERPNIIIPVGVYYFSGTLNISFPEFEVTQLSDSLLRFAPGCIGVNAIGNGGSPNRAWNYLNIDTTGKATDGQVALNDPYYAQFLSDCEVLSTDRSLYGQAPPQPSSSSALVRSINPVDYKFHGFLTNGIIELKMPRVKRFSGNGIVFYAPAIAEGDNTSLSSIDGGEVQQCDGWGMVVIGRNGNISAADGNQMSIRRLSVRNCYGGIFERSGLGNRYYDCHVSTNDWGGYWVIGGSNSSNLTCCYREGDSVVDKLQGTAQIIGGSMDNYPIRQGFGTLIISSNRFSKINTGALEIANTLIFTAFDRFHNAVLENLTGAGSYLNHLQFRFGGTQIGMWEIMSKGRLSKGHLRVADFDSVHMNNVYVNGKLTAAAYDFTPPQGVHWRLNDKFENDNCDGTNPEGWRCIQSGYYGTDTYENQVGIGFTQVTDGTENDGGTRRQLTQPTEQIRYGDTFTVAEYPGTTITVVTPPRPNLNGDSNYLTLSPDLPVPTGKVLMPIYPRARFRAYGRGAGTTAQRPALRQGEDHGWEYWNTDLNKVQTWTGTTYV